jgi:hypothetical protein
LQFSLYFQESAGVCKHLQCALPFPVPPAALQILQHLRSLDLKWCSSCLLPGTVVLHQCRPCPVDIRIALLMLLMQFCKHRYIIKTTNSLI